MSEAEVKKSNWGKGVFVFTTLFVLFILTMVIYVSTIDYQLVENNYYDKGTSFQDKIDKIKNANELTQKPVWSFVPSEKRLIVKFDPAQGEAGISGTVHLFRPSEAQRDQYFEINADQSGLMIMDVKNIVRGLWKIKIDWHVNDVGYYIEDNLILE